MAAAPGNAMAGAIISFEEAKGRFGDGGAAVAADFEQLTAGADDAAGGGAAGGAKTMPFDVFVKSFLGSVFPTVPKELAEALFRAFSMSGGASLTEQDFVRGVAVLRHGTAEERLHLAFAAYDTDSDGLVDKRELLQFVIAAEDTQLAIEMFLDIEQDAQRGAAGKMTLQQFTRWAATAAAKRPQETLSVVAWMFEFEDLLSRKGIRSHHRELVSVGKMNGDKTANVSLAEITGLPEASVTELQAVHRGMQAASTRDVVDEGVFSSSLPSLPKDLRLQLFKALDRSRSGSVSLKELLTAVAQGTSGTDDEKLLFCFRLFDGSGRGALARREFTSMMEILWCAGGLYRSAGGKRLAAPSMSPRLTAKVARLVDEAMPEGKESITEAEFRAFAPGRGAALRFVQALWQLALVDFRVRPSTPAEELDTVNHLNGAGFNLETCVAGSVWCLIDYHWWKEWSQSVSANMDDSAGEAAASWSGAMHRMPQIDNRRLLDANGQLCRNVEWDGRDGGDYEVISQGAWRALASWYGSADGSEIARKIVVIDGRKQLELHPPRLRMMSSPFDSSDDKSEPEYLSFSSTATLEEVRQAAAEQREIPLNECILWQKWEKSDGWKRVMNLKKTLRELDVEDDTGFSVAAAADVPSVKYTTPDGETTAEISASGGVLFTVEGTRYPPVELAEHVYTGSQSFLKCPGFLVKLPTGPGSAARMVEIRQLLSIAGVDCTFGASKPAVAVNWIEEDVSSLTSGTRVECYLPDSAGKQTGSAVRATVLWVHVKGGKKIASVVPLHTEKVVSIPVSWIVKKVPTRDEKNSLGRVGLQNLTNTCYLSSCVQALSHTRLVRDYFLSGRYKYDLNPSSRWGMGGLIAVAFAEQLERLWTTDKPFLAPRNFHALIGRFRPDFATTQQQDANDFLLALLEGLIEDLNRVRSGEVAEFKEPPSNASDDQLAAASWSNHVLRENSFFTALFAWQHKTVRQCGGCEKVTRTLDTTLPPLSLALPLPNTFCATIVLHRPAQKLLLMTSVLPLKGTTGQLTEAVSRMLQFKVPASNLVTLDLAVGNCSFELPVWKAKDEVIRKIVAGGSRVVHMYEAQDYHLPREDGAKRLLAQVVHRKLVSEDKLFASPWKPTLFGLPLMLCTTAATGAELYAAVWVQVKHLLPDYTLEGESYPFVLTRVTVDGLTCSDCSWMRGCIGCHIKSNDQPHSVCHRDTVGIDWDAAVLDSEYKASMAISADVHESAVQEMEQEASEEQLELSSCLSGFFESDAKLDPIVCDACHQICPHTQSVRAWGLPPLLVIQLKRFTWAADTGGRKIKTAVNFPLTDLDLKPNLAAKVNDPFDDEDDANSKAPSPTLNGAVPKKLTSRENTLYDLYAVVNHEGIRTYGHYYCFVKQSNNSWILLNDSKCVPIAESQVVTEKAYLLFYQRKDIEYASLDDVWAMVPDAQPVDIAGVKRSDSKKKAPSPVFSSAAKTAVIKTAAKPKEKSKETCSDCTVL